MLYCDFVKCVNHFLRISNHINDGWTLENYKEHVYLSKSVTQYLEEDSKIRENEKDDLEEESLYREKDDQCLDVITRSTVRKWQYHVLHSLSYQVPVIYFNVWNSNGQLLSLDELWSAVNPSFKVHITNNKWYTLTQQEHPYLFKPFFHFHPCHTQDFLDLFAHPKCNALITWLSSIGQIIWLHLDCEYGKMTSF